MAQSLANKYRPQTLEQVCSQQTVVSIIKSMCNAPELSNRNFLFTGPAGTGKTTLSRIIAKTLNGNTDNIIEVDAASHSGVDATRELIQQAAQYPIGSKYKVIICDEAHAFSSQAWQALLKCLEEQVGNTIWIFATTNPEKIPATIISRVQTFKLSKIDVKTIQERLKFILDNEISEGRQITYTDDALSYLARYANGGMRDAITSLDKCLAYDNNVTSELLEKALDLPNYDDYFNLLNALVKKDNTEIATVIDRVYNSGTNFVKWFEGFHSFLCNIVKFVFLKDISRTMIPYHYQDKLSKYGEATCIHLPEISQYRYDYEQGIEVYTISARNSHDISLHYGKSEEG